MKKRQVDSDDVPSRDQKWFWPPFTTWRDACRSQLPSPSEHKQFESYDMRTVSVARPTHEQHRSGIVVFASHLTGSSHFSTAYRSFHWTVPRTRAWTPDKREAVVACFVGRLILNFLEQTKQIITLTRRQSIFHTRAANSSYSILFFEQLQKSVAKLGETQTRLNTTENSSVGEKSPELIASCCQTRDHHDFPSSDGGNSPSWAKSSITWKDGT